MAEPETLSELERLRKKVTEIQSQLNKKKSWLCKVIAFLISFLGIIGTSLITTVVTLVITPNNPMFQKNVINPLKKWDEERWREYNGSKYRLSKNFGTWEEIEAEAKEYKGNLVTINSAEEQKFLTDNYGEKELLWIGLNDKEKNNDFKWIGDEKSSYTYTNWFRGEPNDDHYGVPEGFVVMNWQRAPKNEEEEDEGRNKSGRWNDLPSGKNPDGGEFSTFRGIIEVKTK
jgi:hypothetical protein